MMRVSVAVIDLRKQLQVDRAVEKLNNDGPIQAKVDDEKHSIYGKKHHCHCDW